MFKTLKRALLPNPFSLLLKKAKQRGDRRFLLGWNRGLGDIALGLYALCHQIKRELPDAEITFLIRENLQEGFQLLEGVKVLVAPNWKRGEAYSVKDALQKLGVDSSSYDQIIEWPDPGYWAKWQLGKLTPKLRWQDKWETLYQKFSLDPKYTYVGMQISAETNYGTWRNWPTQKWQELIDLIGEHSDMRVLLFGYGKEPIMKGDHVIDLRSKTTLFELLSIIKNQCAHLVVPDSGILSMTYYLDSYFPIHLISLWAHPYHGILKQNVASPNPYLDHTPIIGAYKNLASVSAKEVMKHIR